MAEIDLEALAGRVEALEGPDMQADADICRAIGYEVKYHRGEPQPYYEPTPGYSWSRVPSYTASIDAAMTLVPEGFYWEVARGVKRRDLGPYWANCYNDEMLAKMIDGDPVIPGCTPAIALCCAALRARLMEGEGE